MIKRGLEIIFDKLNNSPPGIEEKESDDMSAHHDYEPPKLRKKDYELLKKFKDENNIEEDSWHFRKGASYTANFGIADGWGQNMEPGYIRIHPGVDRAGGSEHNGIKDIVMTPFNFDSSDFIDYNGRSYGSLVILSSKEYQFDLRIAHMHPKNDIIPWALKQFKAGYPYKQDWLIGSAGTYGYSTGAHTHTELVSHDEATEIFEIILEEKYEDANKEYSPEFIYKEYLKREKFKDWSEGEIMEHWLGLKKKRGAFFINNYKMCFFWKGKPYTRYATNKVFNGL
jgi:murein DD-endopeptidase MepM/ murein hydrolase activator NlpD